MPDLTPFEMRLTDLLEADSVGGVRAVDPYAIAQAVVARDTGRRWSGPFAARGRVVPVIVAILLTFLVAAVLVIGSRTQERVSPVPEELTLAPTGAMGFARLYHAATLLNDGRVLVTGGHNGRPLPEVTSEGLSRINLTGEIFDPDSGSFGRTGDPVEARLRHTSTLLEDGRVLIVGGLDYAGPQAELYDPRAGTFTPTGAPRATRSRHAAVRLADGQVAIIGGTENEEILPGVEIYDPSTGDFRPGPTHPLLARVYPSAVVLSDGRVLVAGGVGAGGTVESDGAVFEHAAVWDTSTDAVLDIGALPGTPYRPGSLVVDGPMEGVGHVGGLVAMPDGHVLLFLLDDERGAWTVQAFDPESLAFTFLAELPGRPVLDPVVLGDGRVLLAFDDATSCRGWRAAAFDPASGQSRSIEESPQPEGCDAVQEPTVTAMGDGSVLIAGGDDRGGDTLMEASIVSPTDVTR